MKKIFSFLLFNFLWFHSIQAFSDSLSYETKLNIAKKKDASFEKQIQRIEDVITDLERTNFLDTLGFAHYFVAVRYSDMNSPYEDSAILSTRKALSLFEKSAYKGKRKQVTIDYLIKNLIRKNRYAEAIEAFTKYAGSYDMDDSRIRTEVFILKNIIIAYKELGETEAGLALIDDFLNTYEIDKIGVQELADIYQQESFLEYNRSNYESSFSSIEKALEFEDASNKNQNTDRIVKLYNQKALLYSKLNKIEEATELYNSLLRKELTSENRFALLSNAYNNFASGNKFSIAHTYAKKAYLNSEELINNNNYKIIAHVNLIESFRNSSKIDSALYVGKSAEDLLKKQALVAESNTQQVIYVLEQQMLNHKYKYDLMKTGQDLEIAALYMDKIDSLVPELISNILFDGSLLQKKQEIAKWYDIGVELAFKQKSTESFIKYSDQTKSLSLQNKIYIDDKKQKEIDSIQTKIKQLVRKESELNLEMSLYKSKDINDSLVNIMLNNKDEQRLLLTSLKSKISPTQSRFDYDFSRFSQPEESVLYYHKTDSLVYACHINSKTNEFREIGKTKDIDKVLIKYLENVKNREFQERESKLLYNLLLSPFINLSERLVIIPDQELSLLPFESLIDDNNSYFIENHEVSYALSFKSLVESKRANSAKISTFSIVSPDYDNDYISDISTTKGLSSFNQEFAFLKHTKNEVEFLQNIFDTSISAGAHITKNDFFDELTQADIFHFTGHAISILGNDDLSFLALGKSADQVEQDIFIREIPEHKINSNLVFLNACNTGVGNVLKGEGVYNLARLFFKAGAKSVVSGLWEIEDYSSSEITKSFYSYLKSGKRKSKALQLAKLDYLKNVKLDAKKDPYYWSGLILTGNTEPLFKKWNTVYYLATLILFVFLISVALKRRNVKVS